RNKSGIWGWRSEKMEVVSGYEAKVSAEPGGGDNGDTLECGRPDGVPTQVYSASNVELVTKTRTEHLSDQDKSRSKGSKTPFHSFLGIAQQHGTHNGAPVLQAASPTNPTAITPEEYFDPHFDLETRNIGRPIEMSSKVQRFKATLWLCEQHPLSLAEQVTPIIDLMAISNAHFAKLRDFITLKLPPGFPVKIGERGGLVWGRIRMGRNLLGPQMPPVPAEIPLFHVLNARITFSNLCGCDQPLGSVRICAPQEPSGAHPAGTQPAGPRGEAGGARGVLGPGVWPFPCEVEAGVFEVPAGYTVLGAGRSEPLRDEDDDLLQFAIQQSLLDAGTETDQVTIWEALTNTRPGAEPPPYDEDLQLERWGSIGGVWLEVPHPPHLGGGSPPGPPGYGSFAEQLRLAMALSEREQEERERRRREEDEELQRILRLSLTEK
ncbi:AN13D protein, partial [Cettia cetti]|nr:AN13D protein [Cettia cetti]